MNREQAKVYASLTKEQLITIGNCGYAHHLEFIRKYADGYDLQYLDRKGEWRDVYSTPIFGLKSEMYRVKKPTHMVNGFEVPAPDVTTHTRPLPDEIYCPDPVGRAYYYAFYLIDGGYGLGIERGIAFSNREDAVANAKAMLGIDPNKE